MSDIPVLKTVLVSLVAALVILVVAVLPAEYGIDPTGAGKALGLTEMSGEGTRGSGFAVTEATVRTVEESYTLDPFESMELKMVMHAGDGMVYRWAASGPVEFELHAHGPHMAEGEAIFLSTGRGEGETGSYISTFAGEHGWFFENRSTQPVDLTVTATGHIDGTILYRSGNRIENMF